MMSIIWLENKRILHYPIGSNIRGIKFNNERPDIIIVYSVEIVDVPIDFDLYMNKVLIPATKFYKVVIL